MKKMAFAVSFAFPFLFTIAVNAKILPLSAITTSPAIRACNTAATDFALVFFNGLSDITINNVSAKIGYTISEAVAEQTIPPVNVQANDTQEIITITGNAACLKNKGLTALRLTLVQLGVSSTSQTQLVASGISGSALKPALGCIISLTNIQPGTKRIMTVTSVTDNNFSCT